MGQSISGMAITAREASAALALVQLTEPSATAVGFSAGGRGWFSSALTPLRISPRQRLDDALRVIDEMPMGGTDCSLPMRYATEQKLKVDTFVIYTDSGALADHGVRPWSLTQAAALEAIVPTRPLGAAALRPESPTHGPPEHANSTAKPPKPTPGPPATAPNATGSSTPFATKTRSDGATAPSPRPSAAAASSSRSCSNAAAPPSANHPAPPMTPVDQ